MTAGIGLQNQVTIEGVYQSSKFPVGYTLKTVLGICRGRIGIPVRQKTGAQERPGLQNCQVIASIGTLK
jgi:hypothetical protein